jgi:hypothetical protein
MTLSREGYQHNLVINIVKLKPTSSPEGVLFSPLNSVFFSFIGAFADLESRESTFVKKSS